MKADGEMGTPQLSAAGKRSGTPRALPRHHRAHRGPEAKLG
jgi:hypothetical protein